MHATRSETSPPGRPARPRRRMGLGTAMLLIAGVGFGLWMVLGDVQVQVRQGKGAGPEFRFGPWDEVAFLLIVGALGGVSAVGPPLLLAARGRGPWGDGRFFWFIQGTASWLLWPPVIYRRLQGSTMMNTATGTCYFYGTPLMALYVTAGLIAGGRLRRRRRQRICLSWRERFGLALGLAWACTGLYVLSLLYRDDLGR